MATKPGTSKRPGSVRKQPGRTTWEARVRLPDGSRPSRSFKTQREGWAWIRDKLSEAERGVIVSEAPRKTGDVLLEWLGDVAPRALKPNSHYNYRRCIGYVLP